MLESRASSPPVPRPRSPHRMEWILHSARGYVPPRPAGHGTGRRAIRQWVVVPYRLLRSIVSVSCRAIGLTEGTCTRCTSL